MEFLDTRHPITTPSLAANYVLDYLQQTDLAAMENGSHEIDGKDFFVNIFTFQTNAPDERIWEAHRDYIDIHCVLEGAEILGQQSIYDADVGPYHPEEDYVEIHPPQKPAEEITRFVLKAGYLAIFYPEDAHQTGVFLQQTRAPIRKAVFKLKIS